MMWLRIAAANLRHSPLTTTVNIILLALGTASIVLLLLAGSQFERLIARDAKGIDLVVGAKGSPVQLVLSSVYHADIPTGNIPLAEANRWAKDRRVASAVPLSLGDSYRGFRIVGTTADYATIYNAELQQGRFWQASMQAVVGAAVAERLELKLGASFAGAHGFSGEQAHTDSQYRVVGVLEKTGTVLDRLILTSLDSVWSLHGHADHADESQHGNEVVRSEEDHHGDESGHHGDYDNHGSDHDGDHDSLFEAEEEHEHEHEAHDREITALLIRYSSPMAAITLPRQINAQSGLQAAAPAFEVARLLQLVGLGLDGLRAFAVLLLITAGFSVFAAMYSALKTRLVDLAMLRCLGATRGELLISLLLEGLLLSVVGIALGFALAHGAMFALAWWLDVSRGIGIPGFVWLPQETVLLFALLGIGVIASALPAWQAYRSDVAETLASS